MSDFGKKNVTSEHVQGDQSNLTEPNESVSKSHGPSKFESMLKIEKHTILSSRDETLSRNSNESVSRSIDVVNALFKTSEKA